MTIYACLHYNKNIINCKQTPCSQSEQLIYTYINMLENIFGSNTRVTLLSIFFNSPEKSYFVRELTRMAEGQINSIRRELSNLNNIGLIDVIEDETDKIKKFYKLNTKFILFDELKSIFEKGKILTQKKFIEKIQKTGDIKYLLLSGVFTKCPEAPVDILAVGKIDKNKLAALVKTLEKDIAHPIKYTIMEKKEFEYRKAICDLFLFSLLSHNKIVVIDDMKEVEE